MFWSKLLNRFLDAYLCPNTFIKCPGALPKLFSTLHKFITVHLWCVYQYFCPLFFSSGRCPNTFVQNTHFLHLVVPKTLTAISFHFLFISKRPAGILKAFVQFFGRFPNIFFTLSISCGCPNAFVHIVSFWGFFHALDVSHDHCPHFLSISTCNRCPNTFGHHSFSTFCRFLKHFCSTSPGWWKCYFLLT